MSTPIKATSRRGPLLASGIALVLTSSAFGEAAPLADPDRAQALDEIVVPGRQPEKANSPKYSRPILDTPQSITVVPRTVMDEQNLLTLRDVLSTLPGITFGAGEGGGGYGDSINLRGFSANNDITIDGMRDSAQYTRSDPFNLQSVELINGANSAVSGAGSVGGSINLVSKRAQLRDAQIVSLSAGSDSYGRFTSDSNFVLSESSAFRLNTMAHQNDVPGRDVEHFERWGIAPSIAFGLGTETSLTFNLYHQRDNNIPQYGVPYYNGAPLPGINPSSYFGYSNVDRQDIESTAYTAILEHSFNERFSIRNHTRYSLTDQVSVVDAPQGTFCLSNNLTPLGTSCTVSGIVVPVGFYLPSGPRGLVRDTENRALVNQTDLTIDFATGGIVHTVVAGISFASESFKLDTINLFRNADGSNPFVAPNHLPFVSIANPSSIYTGPIRPTLTGKTDGDLDNRAFYLFDTIEFSPKWLLSLGARQEENNGSSTAYTISSTGNNIGQITGAGIPLDNDESLFSYRAGLVYKPQKNVSLYASHGNSKTPSKASVNGSCVQTANNAAGTNNCNVDAESALASEVGLKWDLRDGRLSFTAAMFRNDRTNYRVADPDPRNLSGEQALDGRARVDGQILGLTGLLNDNWSIYANYAHLDSEILQGASDYVSGLGQDYAKGDPLIQTPKHSASIWSTYDIVPGRWQVGAGTSFQDKFALAQHSATLQTGPLPYSSSYTTHRAMVAYTLNRALKFQFNVNNLGDKQYYTRIRNNGWATPGDGRSYVLTLNWQLQ